MAHRKRVLLIGINQRYINPTNSLLPAVLAKFSDIYLYGPGFVDDLTLAKGVERYIDSVGGVDVIFTLSQCCSGFTAARVNRFLRRYTVLLNGGEVSSKFLADVSEFCRKNQKRVVCFLTDMDPHAVPQDTLDNLLDRAGYFVGWGKGFVDSLADSEAVGNENYLQKKLKRSFTLGLFDNFVDNYWTQIINIGHFVADNEFYWGTLVNRKYDVAVPGSRYARRQGVLNTLKRVDGIRLARLRYRYAFQIAERLSLNPYARFYPVQLYNIAFQRTMSRTKICVTDGGGNNYPVRKFFEIPASGALMVCWPSVGLESLGFRDGVNCLFVQNATDVIEAAKSVVEDVGKFDKIAAAGRDLVFREHSTSARGIQLFEAIQRIEAGTFKGSTWREGQFECLGE